MPSSDRAICWLRRDLRLSDHAALTLATEQSKEVLVVFVFDKNILDSLPRNDKRITFILESLQEIDNKLKHFGSKLCVLHGDPVNEIPKLASDWKANLVVAAEDYEPYARERDAAVARSLERAGIKFAPVLDTVIIRPGSLLNQSGAPFRVYTPFSKAWKKQFELDDHVPVLEFNPDRLANAENVPSQTWGFETIGFEPSKLWLAAGEDAALDRLNGFEAKMHRYAEERDFPGIESTSGLSVHLRFGTVSIRELVRRALRKGNDGAKWLSELVWREFYQDLLWNHPHVVFSTFQPQYNELVWPGEEAHWQAWCLGKTGYPIVDAAMRCLNETGWMHNRLRMITASFLTKDLLISYQRGEAYFAEKLLDFELASNNGGWQWSASVGADAQPYFRIFNPVLQSLKFDPNGSFIRQWVPELAELDSRQIHAPYECSPLELAAANVELGVTYPHPIVNHAVQKELAIKLLESASKQP
jgi:deoxyribodipyrimidine photo-lyase